jgi:hypothetical protein
MEDINDSNRLMQASTDLGGPRHVDCRDGGRCCAVWIQVSKQLSKSRVHPTGWWLLFPDVGLAIELCDGALVSWDGRYAAHCTCVPSGVHDGDQLCSLFMGISSGTSRLSRKQHEFAMCVRADRAGCGGGGLVIGDVVWVRWYPESRPEWYGDDRSWRRRSGKVASVDDSGVVVTWFKREHGVSSLHRVFRDVVRAGCVGPLVESPTSPRGSQLVGKRVCVYWPDDMCCFDGVVEGWNAVDRTHQVAYDDGDVVHELLGSEAAPYWCAILACDDE